MAADQVNRSHTYLSTMPPAYYDRRLPTIDGALDHVNVGNNGLCSNTPIQDGIWRMSASDDRGAASVKRLRKQLASSLWLTLDS